MMKTMRQMVAAAVLAATLSMSTGMALAKPVTVDCGGLQVAEQVVVDVTRPYARHTLPSVCPAPRPIGNVKILLARAAAATGVPEKLLQAVAYAESDYRHNTVSRAGAVGIMQLMPGTAAALGVNPYDPWQNVLGGARYLRRQIDRYKGDLMRALAAYNAGPGAVDKYGGIPPYEETQRYVSKVLAYARGAMR